MRFSETKYLRFVDGVSKSGKTDRISIYSKSREDFLGEIKWFGRWRQYVLFPANEVVFNLVCLNDIRDVIARLMNELICSRINNKGGHDTKS